MGYRNQLGIRVPMRDGVGLGTDVVFPQDAEGKFPTILIRAGYGRHLPTYLQHTPSFNAAGYAVVLQDVRGRGDSDGEFKPFWNEGRDGFDTIEWIASQPWSNGRVGMHGSSYDSFCQWSAAKEEPPHLTTFVSNSPATNFGEEFPWHNGVLRFSVFITWLNLTGGRMNQTIPVDWTKVLAHRPIRTMDEALGRVMPMWDEWLDHPTVDDYWRKLRVEPEDFARIDLPVLHVAGMHDGSNFAGLRMYRGMLEHSPSSSHQELVFGPWGHNCHWLPLTKYAELDLGSESAKTVADIEIPWFDSWLKADEVKKGSEPVRYFVLGANEWRDSKRWPPPEVQTLKFYADSEGQANGYEGNGRLTSDLPTVQGSDSYVFDPEEPTGLDASVLSSPMPSSVDGRLIEVRPDVLVYTTEPLKAPLELLGPAKVVLYASSDCPDTDFFANLADVHPDGLSIALGPPAVMSARHRDSLETSELMEPSQIYQVEVELPTLSCVLKEGHRLRLDILSAFFPVYAPNPNTGGSIADEAESRKATNTIHHSPSHATHLELTVGKPSQ